MTTLTFQELSIFTYGMSAVIWALPIKDYPCKAWKKVITWLIISAVFGWVVLEVYKRGG